MALIALSARPALPADDFGDAPVGAYPVTPSTNPIAGVIDNDVDQDWFCFSALPWVPYSLTVTTGTLWDSTVDLKAPDGLFLLAATNSITSNTPACLMWTNLAPAGKYYVKVGGFAEFTTGTYSLAICPESFADANTNGVPDAWEIERLGGLTNSLTGDLDGDGLSDGGEYYLGTDPADPASGLFLTEIGSATGAVTLGWQAIRYGTYRISAASNLPAAPWSPLATNINLSTNPVQRLTDGEARDFFRRFYRVELIY
jgi:hypothetical protein